MEVQTTGLSDSKLKQWRLQKKFMPIPLIIVISLVLAGSVVMFQNFSNLPSRSSGWSCGVNHRDAKLIFDKRATQFSSKTTGSSSNGGWRMNSNGNILDSIQISSPSMIIVQVKAKHVLLNGGGVRLPEVQVSVGGQQLANFALDTSGWKIYSSWTVQPGLLRKPLFNSGTHSLQVRYNNDWISPDRKTDRDVVIEWVKVYVQQEACTGFAQRYSGVANSNELSRAINKATNNDKRFIGVTIQENGGTSPLDSDVGYRNILAFFPMFGPSNQFKMRSISPTSTSRFLNQRPDAFMAHVHDLRGQPLLLHTLLWKNSVPDFGASPSRQDIIAWVDQYYQQLLSNYQNQFVAIEVLNEPLDWRGGLDTKSFWHQSLGSNYPITLGRLAARYSSGRPLIVTDNRVEDLNEKSDGLLQLALRMRNNGVPVSGVGIQAHIDIDSQPNFNTIRSNFLRFNRNNLDVYITELDVFASGGMNASKLEAQADVYYHLTALCTSTPRCRMIQVWTPSDRYQWKSGGTLGLVNINHRAKPALGGFIRGLQWRNNHFRPPSSWKDPVRPDDLF